MHKATEDFLREFFLDSSILAAHAHCVTVMPKDMHSLRLLCFRYNKSLQPVPLSDCKMLDILYLPLVYCKVKVSEVIVESAGFKRSRCLSSLVEGNVEPPYLVEEPQEFDEARSRQREIEEGRQKCKHYTGLRDDNIESLSCFDFFDVHIPVRCALYYFPFFSAQN